MLLAENDKLKSTKAKNNLNSSNFRIENKLQVNAEIQKLRDENNLLKKYIYFSKFKFHIIFLS